MEEIILYGFKGRSRAERVLWVLNELNLPHKIIRLDYSRGEHNSSEYLSLNSEGKVPILLHGDKVLTESMAICLYLCSLSGSHKLVPKNPIERYILDHRIFYGITEIEPYVWLSDLELFIKREGLPTGISDYSFTQIRNILPIVDSWLNKAKYIVGDSFTIADILYYHLLSWVGLYEIPLPINIQSYLENLEERPSFPESMGVPGSPVTTG